MALPFVDAAVINAPLFQSSPVDCDESAADFLNTVVEIQVPASIDPEHILAGLHRIETALGRPALHPKNSSRIIDLDLLYADTLVLRTPDLILPHPRLHERRFVLAPLAAIRPEMILPGKSHSVGELLHLLSELGSVQHLQACW